MPLCALPAVILGFVAVTSPAATGLSATGRTPPVVVVKKGFIGGDAASGYAEYGLVLRNRSTRDALNINVRVKGVDARGRTFTSIDNPITVIPARSTFVISGALVWGLSVNLAAIKTTVHVRKTARRGRRLPTVKFRLSSEREDIVGSLTNTYKKPLPRSAQIYGLFLDARGRVVAVGDLETGAVVRPRQTVPFDLGGNFVSVEQIDAVRSGRVSVDPCGDIAFGGACPIVGAGLPG